MGLLLVCFLVFLTPKLTGEGGADDDDDEVKKSIAIFDYKQRLLSIDMKTKVIHYVPRIIFHVFKVFKFSSFQNIPGSQLLSDIQKFFIFNF